MRDITGERFGRLIVLRFSHKRERKPYYICQCDCGNVVAVNGYNLIKGNTISCSCYHREVAAAGAKMHNTKHGMYGTRLYSIWKTMLKRCANRNHVSFANYGGRGISVCQEWRDFKNFMDWAKSNGYEDNLTIDRIDANKNYCPSNCKWSTMVEQENNRRNNHYLEFNGETHTIAEWSRLCNVPYATIYARLKRGLPMQYVLKSKIAPASAGTDNRGADKKSTFKKYTTGEDLSNV